MLFKGTPTCTTDPTPDADDDEDEGDLPEEEENSASSSEAETDGEDDEEEADPEWIQFDPETQRERFFGHVMADEQKLRDQVINRKERKVAKA